HDRVGSSAHTEICERTVGRDQLYRIDLRCSDVDRWIRRNWSGDAKIPGLVNDGLFAELHAEADGGDVAGEIERLAERNLAEEFQIVILRRPFGLTRNLEHERTVVDEIRRWPAILDRGRIDDRLERRARLTQRLHRAIELRIVEIPSRDHGAHCTVARVEREERALEVRRRAAAFVALAVSE